MEIEREQGKANAAVGKKTKLVMVQQGYIDALLARPRKPFTGMPAEAMDRYPNPKLRKMLHATMASTVELMKKIRDKEEDILEQYRTKGFAMEEVVIRGDEDIAVEEPDSFLSVLYICGVYRRSSSMVESS
ncbi:hypothetical protein ACP70R_025517 [Stipagrostis hirtigluma subsp. patula]